MPIPNPLKQLSSELPVGERTGALLRGLGSTAPIAFFSRILSGLATLFAARWMGPHAYGEANLALAISLWIQIPLLAGLPTALMHYIPQTSQPIKKGALGLGLGLLFISSLLTLLLALTFQETGAQLTGVSLSVFRMSIFWTAGFGVYAIVTSCQNALEAFSTRAKLDLLFAVLFPLFVIFFWQSEMLNAKRYIIGFCLAYAIAGLAGLPSVLRSSDLSLPALLDAADHYGKRFLSYGALAAANGAVIALLTSSTRLIANRYLPPSDIGLLAAYQGASLQMSAFVLTVGAQVFFPIASRTPDRVSLFKKISALLLPGCLVSTAFFLLLTWAAFLLLGQNYPFDWKIALIFSLAGALATAQGFYSWFLLSGGRRGIILTAGVGAVGGLLTLVGSHWAIPRWGLSGAGLTLVVAYAASIAACFIYRPTSPTLQTSQPTPRQ
jgi:O-antigen/teichoic acid export membrane protein